MAGHAAVGVDDDLAPGQPGVAHRAADHEPAGRVDQEVLVQLARVEQLLGQHGLHHVLPEILLDQRFGALAVLGRDQQLLDLHRPAIHVAHRHLGLAVRAQVGNDLGFAHVGQSLGQLVGHRDRQRHQLVGLVGGVAEHHPLVPGADHVELILVAGIGAGLIRLVDALGDVRRLLVDRVDHRAGVVVEAVGGVRVANPLDRLAGDLLDVDVGHGGDLAGHHDQPRVDERFAGHTASRVVAHHGVEDAIGDLVGDLVGVTLGHRLRGEQVFVV